MCTEMVIEEPIVDVFYDLMHDGGWMEIEREGVKLGSGENRCPRDPR